MHASHPIIQQLLRSKAWPTDELNAISAEAIRAVAPEEERMVLSHPKHFRTVAEEIKYNGDFWRTYGALSEIDIDRSLIIGDFGIGSDTAIIIDSDTSNPDPTVYRLKWSGSGTTIQNHWVIFFERLSELASFLKKQKK